MYYHKALTSYKAVIKLSIDYSSAICKTVNQNHSTMFGTSLNTNIQLAIGNFISNLAKNLWNNVNELSPVVKRTYNFLLNAGL